MRLRDIKWILDQALPRLRVGFSSNPHDGTTVQLDVRKGEFIALLERLSVVPGFREATNMLGWPELTLTGDTIVVKHERRSAFEANVQSMVVRASALSIAIAGIIEAEPEGKIALRVPEGIRSIEDVTVYLSIIREAVRIADPREEFTHFIGVEEGSSFFGIEVSDAVARDALWYLFQFAMAWLHFYMVQRMNLANMRNLSPAVQQAASREMIAQIEDRRLKLAEEFKSTRELAASVEQTAHAMKQLAAAFMHGAEALPALNAPEEVRLRAEELRLMKANVGRLVDATVEVEKKTLDSPFQIPDLELPQAAPPQLLAHNPSESGEEEPMAQNSDEPLSK